MHTVSVSFIKSPQQTASQKCIATESAPRRMARHEQISFLFSKKEKMGIACTKDLLSEVQRVFVSDADDGSVFTC